MIIRSIMIEYICKINICLLAMSAVSHWADVIPAKKNSQPNIRVNSRISYRYTKNLLGAV